MKTRKKGSSPRLPLVRRYEQEQERLTAKLSKTGLLLQGTSTERCMRFGKPSCSCHRDPDSRHGPYQQWTLKRGGKTVTVYLDEEKAKICKKWIQNNKRAEKLMSQMQALTLRTAPRDTTE